MKNKLYLLTLALLAAGCGDTKQKNEDEVRLKIVATTGMLYDAALNIVKDKMEVDVIMGPGVDPHLYKATQGDLRKFRQADVIIYNGLFLEGKMSEILNKQSGSKAVIAAAEAIDPSLLMPSTQYDDAYDPHVWFDVSLWKLAVTAVKEGVIAADTSNAAFYEKNARQYLSRLDSLHQSVKRQMLSIPEEQRILVTAHDAFGYFGRAYGIEVRGLQGISTVSDIGLRDIANLIDLIISRKVKSVFIETSVSDKAIKAVIDGCNEKNHAVGVGGKLFSDAMGAFGTFEGTYIGMVSTNVNTITEGLK